jgi:putative aldouronate transport system permease protein
MYYSTSERMIRMQIKLSIPFINAKSRVNKRAVSSLMKEVIKNKVLYMMLIPGILVLLINNYLPMFGIIIAFKDWDYAKGLLKSPWVGFRNFKYLFRTNDALIITRNTVLYNVVFIIIALTVAVALAIAFNELLNKKASKFYQSVLFLPYFLSWVVISYLVFGCLSSSGLVNQMLMRVGGHPINWYIHSKYWPYIIVFVNTWKWTGYDSIIYLAAIVGIDKSYYEAAAVDGATRIRQIIKITLPQLKPVITVLTVLKVGRIFTGDFGLFYNVPRNSGILFNVTNVIDTYVYRALTSLGDVGMASAAGLYQAFVGFVLVMLANYIVRKIDNENALF